jgi:hypothetical protein
VVCLDPTDEDDAEQLDDVPNVNESSLERSEEPAVLVFV